MLKKYLDKTTRCIESIERIEKDIQIVVDACIDALRNGRKIIFCGNGGSAADAQHLAAEFMGRFLKDRTPLPAISLTVDTSALTAIGNDYGYDEVFARQLRGIGNAGDVLISISTSGNSQNILEALRAARDLDIISVSMAGATGGKALSLAQHNLLVDSQETNIIQESQIVIGHYICQCVEESLF